MKLSEAIRLGAMLGPQIIGNEADKHGGSCAIGAAMLALGVHGNIDEINQDFIDFPTETIESKFPDMFLRTDLGPLGYQSLYTSVACRNDDGMTREEIADWLVESGKDCESVDIAPMEAEKEAQHATART